MYNPSDVLSKIGAQPVFFGEVVAQGTEGEWDRMAIVKYASRVSFMEMQNRPDFKEKHVHKEAGMLYTNVMGTLPRGEHQAIDRSMYCTFELTAAPQQGDASNCQARLAVERAKIEVPRPSPMAKPVVAEEAAPVVKASQDALLPDVPAMLSEGWLKLSGSLAPPADT